MKQLFDYFPVLVFFSLYFYGGADNKPDIMLATWGIIVACSLQVILGWAIWRKVQRMHLLVLAFTLVFGGLTLFLNDEAFIKWRTSIIYYTLAGVLVIGQFTPGRNLLQRLGEGGMQSTFGRVIPVAPRYWTVTNLAFAVYYAFLACANLYVAYNFSTDFWVKFKLIGMTLSNFIFYPTMLYYIWRNMPAADREQLLHDQPTAKEIKNEHEHSEQNLTADKLSAEQPSTEQKEVK